ncbi:MAG: DUF2239 family protein [Phenylobacterium sp.]|uniref:DUF2239 family protein n=1 Tax=Phenylobacterium sp. TaxID=1871053 RepID=UPI002728CC11|nr:DUF2239 family protein [Phenylobacterium sp.]MDO8408876.1 DUF2239 family protein [Phenylobacterium sp.]
MTPTLTAFVDGVRIASGDPAQVAAVLRARADAHESPPILLSDADGRPVDIDLRASPAPPTAEEPSPARATRGRPRLGVVPREVTLLPRHWDWLAAQPGGASAALRRLVEEARRTHADADRLRTRREAAYRAMSALAGDAAGFEAAARALFADDRTALDAVLTAWPPDVAAYIQARLEA